MDLNAAGGWASIISLPLSLYALYRANNIKKVLRILTRSARSDIVALIKDLNDFYLTKFPFLDAQPKRIITRIEVALQLQPDIAQLKRDLDSLETLIFTSTRV
jgi:hypothetical protein